MTHCSVMTQIPPTLLTFALDGTTLDSPHIVWLHTSGCGRPRSLVGLQSIDPVRLEVSLSILENTFVQRNVSIVIIVFVFSRSSRRRSSIHAESVPSRQRQRRRGSDRIGRDAIRAVQSAGLTVSRLFIMDRDCSTGT